MRLGFFSRKSSSMIKLANVNQNHSEMAAEICFSLDEFLWYFQLCGIFNLNSDFGNAAELRFKQ